MKISDAMQAAFIDEMEKMAEAPNPRGQAARAGKAFSDFDPKKLRTGAKIEMKEHGVSAHDAKSIAADHLTENPGHYDRAKMASPSFDFEKEVARAREEHGRVHVLENAKADIHVGGDMVIKKGVHLAMLPYDHEKQAVPCFTSDGQHFSIGHQMKKTAADLTAAGRDHIKEKNFALPEQRRYPIHDESHARAALSMVAAHGTPDEKARVRSAVARKYPGISQSKTKESSILQNIGNPIVHTGNWVAGGFRNVGKTMGDMFSHPIQSTVAGAKWTVNDLRGLNPQNPGKHPIMAGLMGLGLVMGANDLRKKEDPSGQGRGRAERVGDFLGSQVGGLIGARHGLAGGLAGGIVGQRIGAAVGKVGDRLRGYRPPPGADTRFSTSVMNSVSPVPVRRGKKTPPVVQAQPDPMPRQVQE